MSSSQQTVFFNTPQSITNLNVNTGLDTVLNSTISTQKISAYLQSLLPSTVGTTGPAGPASTDVSGVSYNNMFAIWGNGFSGEQYFWATGPLSRTNPNTYTKDTYIRSASSCKIANGLFLGKMMEEGYFRMDETVGAYLPEFAAGNYNYVVSAT